MKKRLHYPLMIAAALFVFASCGKRSETDTKELAKDQNEEKFDDSNMEDDTKFAVAAADGGLLEVQLGQLAISNASSDEVKKIGQGMIDDHSKANEELKALAATKNISLPGALSEKHQKAYEEFAKKTGPDFDEDYLDQMVKDHKDNIDHFKKEADQGKDPELKTWAAGKVPTLEHHLMMVESAQKTLKDLKK